MNLPPLTVATTVYGVEVSGWDSSRSFFVEKADLAWSESGEKLVALRHEIGAGTILFVRLLQPISPDRSHPVPHGGACRSRQGSRSGNIGSRKSCLDPARGDWHTAEIARVDRPFQNGAIRTELGVRPRPNTASRASSQRSSPPSKSLIYKRILIEDAPWPTISAARHVLWKSGPTFALTPRIVPQPSLKSIEVLAPRASLTPCILDDDPAQLEMLFELIANLGYEAIPTSDPERALQLVRTGKCRLVLADVHMPGMGGYEFLDMALRGDPGVHVIVMTGDYTLDSALDAIRRGATDFLPKPIDRVRLKRTLDETAALYDQRRRVKALEEQLLKDLEFHGIVGKSPAMLEVFDFARKVARHYTNVLLVGPTGTGKELVAHAIHQLSPVSQQRLAICNCSALVDTLLESQLFGHMRGAFTGATETRPGLFEYANGGTVFLDEVGETSLTMQAKLLRVIQNREIQRVGSPEVRQVNVRLIAATNRDLRTEVLAGRFREDLFYRLSSIQIRIPSLTERLEDIPLLVQFFLKKYNEAYGKNIAGLTRRAQTALLQHPWPGNVRELENVVSSACITATGDFIDLVDLPEQLQHRNGGSAGGEDWRPLPLEDVRKIHIQRVLEMCQGNRLRAAQILGIGRTSLYRYLKRGGAAERAARNEGAAA